MNTPQEDYFQSDGYKKIREKEGFNHIGKALLFQVGLSLIIPIIISLLFVVILVLRAGGNLKADEIYNLGIQLGSSSWYLPIIMLVTALSANIVPFVICANKINVDIVDLFKPRKFGFVILIQACIATLGFNMFGSLIVTGLTSLFDKIGLSMPTPSFIIGDSGVANLLLIICTCILAPITEEFIFRGVLLKFFSRKGTVFGILISALLFAIVHGNIPQAVGAFLIGIVYGYIAVKTKSILVPIIAHAFNNSFAMLQGSIADASGDNSIGSAIMAVLLIGFLIATVVLVILEIVKWQKEKKTSYQSAIIPVVKVRQNGWAMAFTSWSIILSILAYLAIALQYFFASQLM